MPGSIQIGLFVLGAILLLAAILGGNFKLFGAEIAATISNRSLRIVAFLLGLSFIAFAVFVGDSASSDSGMGLTEPY